MEECQLLEFQSETLCESTNGQYVDIIARRMGVDAGEIAMIASQGSIRRMSSVSKVCVATKIMNSVSYMQCSHFVFLNSLLFFCVVFFACVFFCVVFFIKGVFFPETQFIKQFLDIFCYYTPKFF